jgi:predicted transcriptional regulator
MERTHDLFFELSNEYRVNILQALANKPGRITAIANEVGINNQECSRHMTRMTGDGLIRKSEDGSYHLTPYGRAILRFIPGFEYLSKNRDYFISHTLAKLPDRFVARIGDLNESRLTPDVMVSIGEFESILREAQEYVWVIIDQRTPSVRPLVARVLERGVKLRSLSVFGEHYDEGKRELNEEDERIILQGYIDGQVESGDLEDASIFLYMSEKAAFIAFPLEDGSFDYRGFTTTDPKGILLCADLFKYCWEQAYIVPKPEFIDRIYRYLKSQGLDIEES